MCDGRGDSEAPALRPHQKKPQDLSPGPLSISRLLKNAHLRRCPCLLIDRQVLRHCGVHPSTPLADSPTRRRGRKSLLIRRDATLRFSGALHLDIFEQSEKN